jgi:hypothetical protein
VTGTIGGRAAVADDGAKERKQVFLAIVGFFAACLGVAGLALMRRGRRSEERSESIDTAEAPETSEPRGDDVPQLGAITHPLGHRLPVEEPDGKAAAEEPNASAQGKICPTCGVQYGAEAEFCGKDGTSLVLLN